jgi:hypothetical protein
MWWTNCWSKRNRPAWILVEGEFNSIVVQTWQTWVSKSDHCQQKILTSPASLTNRSRVDGSLRPAQAEIVRAYSRCQTPKGNRYAITALFGLATFAAGRAAKDVDISHRRPIRGEATVQGDRTTSESSSQQSKKSSGSTTGSDSVSGSGSASGAEA